MAKGSNQKLKIVYLIKILTEKTDEQHSITMNEIISELKAYGVNAERKSLYNDIENLRQYGLDIVGEQHDRTYYYYLVSRQFELAELKLLVDSVQSAKFITERKTNQLIKKIEGLASKYQASQLQHQVYVSQRVKTTNEKIYYNVDKIHTAIDRNSMISFQYFQWNVKKKMVLKKDGEPYIVSPWALTWDDENYYMVAIDSSDEKVKHFRVDKMLNIEFLDKPRLGGEKFSGQNADVGLYAKKVFGMFSGEEEIIKLECKNEMAGVIIDRFGKDTMFIPKDDEHFTANVKVIVSNQFISWIFSLGDGVKIVGPEDILEKVKRVLPKWEGTIVTYSAKRRYRLDVLMTNMIEAVPKERRWVLDKVADVADFTEFIDPQYKKFVMNQVKK